MTFVAAKCPQCGGELQLNPEVETGFCMHCGSKIVVMDAIKAVRVDNSHMIDTWMQMGDLAVESGNYKEAYDNYTKVIEAQPTNWNAMFKRGKAAGWQSTLANIRLLESALSFAKAIELAPRENRQRDHLILDSVKELLSLSLALIALRANRFENWPDEDEANKIFNDVNTIETVFKVFTEKSGVQVDDYLNSIGQQIDLAVSSAFYGKISSDYNGDDYHPGQFQFYQYLERIDLCINILEKTINLCEGDYEANIERYKQIISFENKALDSCSWDYTINAFGKDWHKDIQLTSTARQLRREDIDLATKKITELSELKKQAEIAEEQEKERIEQEKKKKNFDDYWSLHIAEKSQFEKEKTELENELDNLIKQEELATISLIQEIQIMTNQSEQLVEQKERLGLFKGKERQSLQMKIENIQSEINNKKLKVDEIKEPYDIKIKELKTRIDQIKTELTMER